MLVIDGAINPAFDAGSVSLKWRSGVCAPEPGRVAFLVSEAPVSFHAFARAFRDGVGCRDALFLDGTLSVNASIYRIDWFGEQLRAQTTSGTVRYVVNGGNTATNGGEIEVKYRPTDSIDLGGSMTYVDSFLEQSLPAAVVAAGTPGSAGDTLPFTAHLSFNLNGEYHQQVMEGWQGYFGLMLNYRSEEFSSFRSGGPGSAYTKLPEYYLLDARLGVRSDSWDVSLFVKNLNNAVAYQGVYDLPPDTPRIFSSPPRTIGLSVSAKF
jgi:outer membrane receptor protein involved in Fe transport